MVAEKTIADNIAEQIKTELEKKGIELIGSNTKFWNEMNLEECTPE